MCGFSFILNKQTVPVEHRQLEEITRLIAHRGPDGEGFYHYKNAGLGHRRLSIIDLSSAGTQPMHYMGKYSIVFNGEIYNYVELKTDLRQRGYIFDNQTDTEVIMAAYDCWGVNCLSRFNGMWAFVLLDKSRDEIFCSRDRFGVKPFYVLQTSKAWIFGSEIKQLLPFLEKRRINQSVLAEYLVLGFEEVRDETFFSDILKLPAGHYIKGPLNDFHYKPESYYQLQPAKHLAGLKQAELTAMMEALLDDAIALRLRSDVQVGTCLSGGLDSSTIASMAGSRFQTITGRQFLAITASSTDPLNDEKHFAEMVVNHCNLKWHVTSPATDDFMQVVDQVIQLQEEPFGSASIVMQYFVMKAAHALNCPVMLDGQGGDETLLGYERYYPAYLAQLPVSKKWQAAQMIAKNSKWSLMQLLKAAIYFTQPKVRLARQKKRFSFLKNGLIDQLNPDLLFDTARAYGSLTDLQKIEISRTQLPHLLRYEDKNSMFFGIETRLPFLDYRFIEASLGLPADLKINKGFTKYVLREIAAKKLPAEIAWRKVKYGFEAPSKQWLQLPAMQEKINKSAFIHAICSKVPIDTADLNVRWKLFNLARWSEMYEIEL